MTKPDIRDEGVVPGSARYWRNLVLWSLGLGIFLPLLILPVSLARKAGTALDWLLIAGLAIAAVIAAVVLWRTAPDFTLGEPRTARGNRMRMIIWSVVIIGPLLTFPIIYYRGTDGARFELFSNGTLPGQVVWPMIALWSIFIPLLGYFTRRNADDFTLAANDFGFMAGGYMFYFVAPVWWLAWRGGLAPRPDVMILFVAMLVVVNVANLWKRHHG